MILVKNIFRPVVGLAVGPEGAVPGLTLAKVGGLCQLLGV
jgi:hypothetical protein